MPINIEINIDAKYLSMFCAYLYKEFGIYTEDNKKILLAQKLIKLMSEAEIDNIGEYYHYIVSPPISERQKLLKNKFIDTVTVHKTNFFRENNHFSFIKAKINEILEQSINVKYTRELRVWSSACSTGEEAYTLAMLFDEILPPDVKVKILATDISPDSIRKALVGTYKFNNEDNITNYQIKKYFTPSENLWRINDEIRQLVTFRLFNLMEPFPFKHPFDIIFCRNVMIYFNHEIQETLVNKFYDTLTANGLLFIGHSESLIQLKHKFGYYEPTVYKRI